MKLVALSDLHGFWEQTEIPNGDVLIFAGDITRTGSLTELVTFNTWLGQLPHQHKIVIAGNHDWCFENLHSLAKGLLTNAIYLEDTGVAIDGVIFWGSPWTPQFYDWAFMLPRGNPLAEKWIHIPKDTDVLITHGPPHEILDAAIRRDSLGNYHNEIVGCEELRKVVDSLPLKAHIFGHIHNQHGAERHFYNVSICNDKYDPINPATVIEI